MIGIISRGRLRAKIAYGTVFLCIYFASGLGASADGDSKNIARKALVIGWGPPVREANGGMTHPQAAAANFLRLVGNPKNDPAVGWTCDFAYDLMVRVGLNPTNTPLETLFRNIG